MLTRSNELNGAWEERGVIGTRIEISGSKITVLWRSSPVLQTSFKKSPRDGGIELILRRRGLRYRDAGCDYAEIKELYYKDGILSITEVFPITGESSSSLSKTENSRYGNYTFADEKLLELQGTWKDLKGYFTLVFKGDRMRINNRVTRIHLLRPNSYYTNTLRVADHDASVEGWEGISSLEYREGRIYAYIHVQDAKPVIFEITKVD